MDSGILFWTDAGTNKIYKVKNTGGYIGIIPSAYGEFLCTCKRVIYLYGYQNQHSSDNIDFESRESWQGRMFVGT